MPLVLDYSDSLKRRPQGQTRRSTSLLSIESMISGMQLLPTGYRGAGVGNRVTQSGKLAWLLFDRDTPVSYY